MRLNTKAIIFGILSFNIFAFFVMSFSGNTPHSIPSASLRFVPPFSFLLIHIPSLVPSWYLSRSFGTSSHSSYCPFALPLADSLVSSQELVSPIDPVTNQTPPLPLRRSDQVRAPLTYLRDYSCFFTVISPHESHTYREACTNPLWQQVMTEEFQALEKTHT